MNPKKLRYYSRYLDKVCKESVESLPTSIVDEPLMWEEGGSGLPDLLSVPDR